MSVAKRIEEFILGLSLTCSGIEWLPCKERAINRGQSPAQVIAILGILPRTAVQIFRVENLFCSVVRTVSVCVF